MAVLDSGATANSARFKWLGSRASVLKEFGVPRAQAYPAGAKYKFGNGRLGEVRNATDIPVGIAGGRGKVTASLKDPGVLALLRKSALESLGAQLDIPYYCDFGQVGARRPVKCRWEWAIMFSALLPLDRGVRGL